MACILEKQQQSKWGMHSVRTAQTVLQQQRILCAGFSVFNVCTSVIEATLENVHGYTSKLQERIIFSVNPFYRIQKKKSVIYF